MSDKDKKSSKDYYSSDSNRSSRMRLHSQSEENVKVVLRPPSTDIQQKGKDKAKDKESLKKRQKEIENNKDRLKDNYGRKKDAEDMRRLEELSKRRRRNLERVEALARPNSRRLQCLWDEKCEILPKDRRDKIKSALEEDYFLSPEQTEQYFQALYASSNKWRSPGAMTNTKEATDKEKEMKQRQKWLVNFSAQVAYRLCDYISKGQKELLVSNRLRAIADVVLERVAEILGEPKPTRTNPGRLARFMVAISDRIAVWIENAVYRADAIEPAESEVDEHIRLDVQKPLTC